MKTLRTPAIVLAALCVGFLIYLACSTSLLPERVAIHFGASGQPNGWMSRSTHLVLMGALGMGLPLISVIIALVIRLVPARFINLPNRDYWLSPERQSQTCIYISRQLIWLACLEVVFFAGIQFLIVEANRIAPVQLPMEMFLWLIGGFLVAVALWVIVLIRHFIKVAE
jgi:serine/threonine-protein kinase